MRPMLLPGTHLLRRDAQHSQAGLVRPRPVVVPGRPTDTTTLDRQPGLVAALLRSGMATVDDHALRAALPAAASGATWPRHTLAALARRTGARLPEALSRRARQNVVLRPFGHPLSTALAEDLAVLCGRLGLATPRRTRPGPPRRGSGAPAFVHVLVGVGEPSRDLVDPWLHDGTPHLVVRLVEGEVLLGPLVVPGETACLRCIDAYLTEEDPAWPLLVEQYARATSTDRADGIPEPVDAALATVAVGWAARDLAAYAEGGDPTTWSRTVRLSAGLDAIETREWPAHPHCGCVWS